MTIMATTAPYLQQIASAFSINVGPYVIAPPPATGWGVGITLLQMGMALFRPFNEIRSPMQYSKFAADTSKYNDPIPGRTGMFIVYAPAFLMSLYLWVASPRNETVALLLLVHFAKRVLEVLFLHKFGGTMSKEASVSISTYYALVALMINSFALPTEEVDSNVMTLGIFLFIMGQLGNLYHHYLLTTLRTNTSAESKEKKRYVAPRGGLFSLVAAPHYFCELVSWLGIAICTSQINAFIELLSHTLYLMIRADQTNQIYIRQFNKGEWPRSRKRIFPFIY